MIDYSPSLAIQVEEAIDMKYVDRGDPANVDFEETDLTLDGLPHNLDLAAIVPPEGANHLVHVVIIGESSAAGIPILELRKPGNTHWRNEDGFGMPVATLMGSGSAWVMMDSNREINYRAPATATAIKITVRGYWTD